MDSYLDIRVLPDPEFPAMVLMSALFSKLHRGLVELENDRIGVSFPEVEQAVYGLGERLRLHGNTKDLEALMALPWLTGMRDQVRVASIMPVPATAMHRVVRRVQAKSSPERLRRRLMKRKGLSEAEARLAVPDSVGEFLDLPYVVLTSHSNGQRFRLFIEHGPETDTPVTGRFNRYGLANEATIPWF